MLPLGVVFSLTSSLTLLGGRHEAQELEKVSMELASAINQGMKDVDCVRRQGERVIEEAYKVYQRNECEMEKLKQCICAQFEEKVINCLVSRLSTRSCSALFLPSLIKQKHTRHKKSCLYAFLGWVLV